MVFTLVIAGIALLLLLLGTAIPQLRGMITEVKDLELSDGLSVSIITEFIIYYNFIYHKSIYTTASSPSYNCYTLPDSSHNIFKRKRLGDKAGCILSHDIASSNITHTMAKPCMNLKPVYIKVLTLTLIT